ncbi:protein asteroid-like isoform X2 [Phymastichus coffea]|uniref:protein asteroid-like isoform X2 n=1 Tax=Phymastichus coffea TaxID=108790 RepID=UPI00273AA9D9|nr:protein asteroid-like isoform X2 [Phymastichus coffea]
MGIPGLASYIKQRSETFSKRIELHDTKLVIDGYCIACELYIVQRKNITIVQSLFEADNHIGSIARILHYPVLSNDSDFFIFDVKYIPYSSLENGIFINSSGNGYVKYCRVFTNDNFIKNFHGMNKTSLPLAAALLGNDYIDSNLFEHFFSSISISDVFKESDLKNKLHYRIEMLFRWLQHHSLDYALTIILDKLDIEKRESIVEMIEMIINGYLVLSSEMLKPLGYTSEEINELTESLECKYYKFDRAKCLELSEKKEFDCEILSTLLSDDITNTLFINECSIIKSNVNTQVNESIPSWFLKEYNAAKFPGYFMDMLHQQLIVCSVQMENYQYPACIVISLNIIRVIFRLLSNGTNNSKMLQYIARGKGANIKTYELDCNDDNFFRNLKLPTLDKLIELSKLDRKKIFISTLDVSDEFIMKFPPTWRLYVAIITYWSKKADNIFVTKWHVYSLVLMMIYHVVKKVIQFGSYFNINPGDVIIKNIINENKVQVQLLVDMPVKNALEKLQKADCIKTQEFFTSIKNKNQENFNITIVHAFSLLQNSLKYGIHLNTLLGYPYPNLDIAEFFSGTMIYNFYKDLRPYNHLNERIKIIFANSPSILQLFISISTTFQTLVTK